VLPADPGRPPVSRTRRPRHRRALKRFRKPIVQRGRSARRSGGALTIRELFANLAVHSAALVFRPPGGGRRLSAFAAGQSRTFRVCEYDCGHGRAACCFGDRHGRSLDDDSSRAGSKPACAS
jgi:hypothetical protein